VVITGRIEPLDVEGLCERVRAALEQSAARVVVCDVAGLVAPDAVAVDALARLQLTAKRMRAEIRLRGASDELRDLLDLTGLCEALPCPEPADPSGGPA
jgi:ABC-type transporter Mla MlaB component